MSETSVRKPRRSVWFLFGIIFMVLAVGATAYFMPLLDCPTCEPPEEGVPEAGEVSQPYTCSSCEGKHTLTVYQYIQIQPIKVRLPGK